MPLAINSTTYVSPNYNKLPSGQPLVIDPEGILIHSDEGTRYSSLPLLCNPAPGGNPNKAVSCQYYVCRPVGERVDIYQLVADIHRSWHAGASSYDGLIDWNRAIGIECEHKAGQNWPQQQLDTLASLCRDLIARHRFPQSRIAAHRWVAVPEGRKTDPSNWPDVKFKPWVAALYSAVSTPLRAAQLPGIGKTVYCSEKTAAFYTSHGGLGFFGFPTSDERATTGEDEQPCTILPCERAVIKTKATEAAHQALLKEVFSEGWV